MSSQKIYKALVAEEVEGLAEGYTNIHLPAMCQKKIAYGSTGFPLTSNICRRDVSYAKGICPVAKELHDKNLLGCAMLLIDLSDFAVDFIGTAF